MPDVRLIDANAAKKALTGWVDNPTDEEIEHTIDELPTIDAVPVVRCRECKHRGYDFCPMCHDEDTYDEDDGGDYFTVDNTTDDGFCHRGKKTDGGAD